MMFLLRQQHFQRYICRNIESRYQFERVENAYVHHTLQMPVQIQFPSSNLSSILASVFAMRSGFQSTPKRKVQHVPNSRPLLESTFDENGAGFSPTDHLHESQIRHQPDLGRRKPVAELSHRRCEVHTPAAESAI